MIGTALFLVKRQISREAYIHEGKPKLVLM